MREADIYRGMLDHLGPNGEGWICGVGNGGPRNCLLEVAAIVVGRAAYEWNGMEKHLPALRDVCVERCGGNVPPSFAIWWYNDSRPGFPAIRFALEDAIKRVDPCMAPLGKPEEAPVHFEPLPDTVPTEWPAPERVEPVKEPVPAGV